MTQRLWVRGRTAGCPCGIYISPKGEVTERQVFFDDDIRVPGRQFSRVEGEDGAFLKGSITSRYLDILLRDGTLMNCHGLDLKEAAARLEDGSNMELSGYCNRFSLECRDGSLARCRRLECGYVYADIKDGSSASVSARHGVDGYCEDGSILDTDRI